MDHCKGILVGCDQNQQWLLEWWWNNFIQENTLPVAFADFGMSEQGKKWCLERGPVLPVPTHHFKTESTSDARAILFNKPLSFFHSPFEKTIWIDLDCEILGNLEPIYQFIDPHTKMGLVCVEEKETSTVETFSVYNSGVIVFEKTSVLLKEWIEHLLEQSHRYKSDDEALSHLIFEKRYTIGKIPEIYNWLMCKQLNPGAVVLHWSNGWGKQYIQMFGGLRCEIETITKKSKNSAKR